MAGRQAPAAPPEAGRPHLRLYERLLRAPIPPEDRSFQPLVLGICSSSFRHHHLGIRQGRPHYRLDRGGASTSRGQDRTRAHAPVAQAAWKDGGEGGGQHGTCRGRGSGGRRGVFCGGQQRVQLQPLATRQRCGRPGGGPPVSINCGCVCARPSLLWLFISCLVWL